MNSFPLIKIGLKVFFLEIDYLFILIKIHFANKVMSF